MQQYEPHEIAELFPMMSEEELLNQSDDIKKNGLLHPILLFDGKILDGRNRYTSCKMAGVEPRFDIFTGTFGEALQRVWSENVQRRHLTSSQCAAIIVSQEDLVLRIEAEAQERYAKNVGRPSVTESTDVATKSVALIPPIKSRDILATIAGTSPRYVSDAKKIKKTSPELLVFVQEGKISIPEANSINKLEPEIRDEVVKTVKMVKKPKVKDISRDVQKDKRIEEVATFVKENPTIDEPIYKCACADIDLADDSIDLIFTDPPYSPDFLSVYGDLADLASRVLKPGALCIAYAGDMYLPEIIDQMRPHLEWVMVLNQYMPDSNLKMQKTHVYTVTRNMVVFKKPGTTNKMFWVPNTVQNMKRSKEYHEWGQGSSAAERYIEAYTEVGETVLDPFVGGGTFVSVAKHLGRKYIGYDIDEQYVNTTIKRLTNDR